MIMSSGAGVVAAIVPSSVVVVREVWVSSAVASGSGPSTGATWGIRALRCKLRPCVY